MAMIREKNEELASLRDFVSSLKSKIAKLESTIDEADAYERRKTVIITGPPTPIETAGEISSSVVTAIIKEKLIFRCRQATSVHRTDLVVTTRTKYRTVETW